MSESMDSLAMVFWMQGPLVEASALAGFEEVLQQALQHGVIRADGDKFGFVDQEELIARAARHLALTELVPLLKEPKELFVTLHEAYLEQIRKNRLRESERFSGQALAYLQNEIDGADIFALGAVALKQQAQTFDVLTPLRDAVPYLRTIDAASLMGFVRPSHASTKNDYMGGILYNALSPWFAAHLDVAAAVETLHVQAPCEQTAALFRCALQSLVQNDLTAGIQRLMQHCASSKPEIAAAAMSAFGLINWPDGSEQLFEEALGFVRTATRDPTGALYSQATMTIADLVARKPEHHAELSELAATATPQALHAVSYFLAFEAKHHRDQPWFRDLALLCVPNDDGRALSNMDMVLSAWASDVAMQPFLIAWLDKWVAAQDRGMLRDWNGEGMLSSTVHKLLEQPRLLSKLVTDWLIRVDLQYPLVVQSILQMPGLGDSFSLTFDKAAVDRMDQKDLVLLVRRTLGYVFSERISRALLWSLADTDRAEARTFGLVSTLFIERVGYDYPRDTKAFLIEKRDAPDASAQIKALCNHIVQSLDAYAAALEALPRIKELKPSYQKAVLFSKARWKQMDAAHEKAQEHSIVRQIAMRIPLKAGSGSFSLNEGAYSEKMHLSTFSHEIAIPRSSITDDAGSHVERLMFRHSQRDT